MQFRQTVLIALISTLVALPAVLGSTQRSASAVPSPATAAGGEHNCIVASEGALKCWGNNRGSQLGSGTAEVGDLTTIPVDRAGFGSDVTSVGAGLNHTCVVSGTGGLRCAGKNSAGQLGDGQACGGECATPVDVTGLTSGVAAVDGSIHNTCALTTDGAVRCWGLNTYGQLGDGTNQAATKPVEVVGLSGPAVALSVGTAHACAVTDSGRAECWGHNWAGQLGNGTANGHTPNPKPEGVISLDSAVAIAAGESHSCALTSSGGVKCWGSNDWGELGDGTTTRSSVPVDVVGLDSGVVSISASGFHSCAVMTDGGAKCWGWNGFGQLGVPASGFQDIRATPVDVCLDAACSRPLADVAAIGAGGLHNCALRGSGTVKCWGYNGHGQLGNATTVSSDTPVHLAIDTDADGCWDGVEVEAIDGSEYDGGKRSPDSFWDFYDVWTGEPPVRGRMVDIGDLGAVTARFGATRETPPTEEEALAEALTPPTDANGYHAAFDRGAPIEGQDVWDLSPPDGSIDLTDIGAVTAQFGHSCA